MKKKLSGIFFDIDDTMYSTTAFAEKARLNAIKYMIKAGLKISEEECLATLLAVISEFPKNYDMHFNKLLNRLGEKYYKNINPNIIVAAAVIGYHETKHNELMIYEDVDDVLKILSQTKLTMGIITAGLTIKQAEKIVRLGVNQYVDNSLIFITDECGYAKTNPLFYKMAIEKSGLPARELLYVGDSPESDMIPSKNAGMYNVLVRRGGKYDTGKSGCQPDYTIQNFWELLELIKKNFSLQLPKY